MTYYNSIIITGGNIYEQKHRAESYRRNHGGLDKGHFKRGIHSDFFTRKAKQFRNEISRRKKVSRYGAIALKKEPRILRGSFCRSPLDFLPLRVIMNVRRGK